MYLMTTVVPTSTVSSLAPVNARYVRLLKNCLVDPRPPSNTNNFTNQIPGDDMGIKHAA